jgi:signal transduction histidine kinase
MGTENPPAGAKPGRHDSLGGLLAFVITIVAGYASATPSLIRDGLSAGNLVLLGVLGVAYTLAGTILHEWFAHRAAPALRPLYFAVQLLLAGVIIFLCRANGFIVVIIFPLVTQARQMLTPRLAFVMYALIGLTVSVVVYLVAGLLPTLDSLPVVIAGLVFVGVFTEVALNERAARAEVERLASELQAANQKLREYAAQVEELATAKERNRLAREIHDSLGHYLTVINVQLEAAQLLVAGDPERATAALRKAQSLAQEGLADVRRSVAALRAGPTGSRPLPEAVAELAEESRAAGIITNLDVRGAPRSLPPQAELTLYRAAQEALTNVRKHARASRADLTLDYGSGDRVRLVVQDNGVGAAEPNGGFGLLGLRERVQLVGGSVLVHSAPGEGFRLEVEALG